MIQSVRRAVLTPSINVVNASSSAFGMLDVQGMCRKGAAIVWDATMKDTRRVSPQDWTWLQGPEAHRQSPNKIPDVDPDFVSSHVPNKQALIMAFT
jgi:hypothetical protein